MKKHRANKRGSTLVLAMFMLVILLGMSVSLMYDARAQASMTSAVKLSQYYNSAAYSIINKARANLADSFEVPELGITVDHSQNWFGPALTGAKDAGGYGNLLEEGPHSMNAGMLEVHYKLYIANNPGDPAFFLDGMEIAGLGDGTAGTITSDWDFDAQAVLTVEIFADAASANPLTTISSMVGRLGSEVASPHSEQLTEGTVEGVGNQGLGGLGSADRISIESLRP